MTDRSLTGACLCGNITYRIDLPSDQPAPPIILCHCTSCKRYTGSGFSSNIVIPLSALHFLTGTPKLYMSPSEVNGLIRRQFCGDCGSPLTSEPKQGEGQSVVVKSGTLDEASREACGALTAEIWYHRKDGWVDQVGGEGVVKVSGSTT
ncbi:DUF636 domain protein [Aspergillus steynii IBT 23096]|uniref:DUF636 domain protein n=1 Tax=Aspergillus steynii IBT 23096 TaxID=1392250 RepID=A0A2I2GLU9_9EURO|nr:DUF636 domain protein [Aspergillus steynii IBT 23096]PLB53861.1 DUF636 domain protein [Aspergillus steynii IBT 23096]